MDNHCSGKIILVSSSKNKLKKFWICKNHNSTKITNITGTIYAIVWCNSCTFILSDYISENYDICDADTILLNSDDEEMIMHDDNREE